MADSISYSTFYDLLSSRNVTELKKRLALLTKDRLPTRKHDVIQLIVDAMKGQGLRQLWSRLDDIQKAAIMEAVHSWDGALYRNRFMAKYGQIPDWGTGKYDFDLQPSLLYLFFVDGMLASDIRSELQTFVPKPPPVAIPSVEEMEPIVIREYTTYDYATRRQAVEQETLHLAIREMEQAALSDVMAALRLVSAGKIAVSDKTQQPTAASITQLTAALSGGDFYPDERLEVDESDEDPGPIRAFAWPLILQAARLAARGKSKLELTTAGTKALSAPPAEILRTCWKSWMDSTLLDELRRVNAIKGQTGRGQSSLTSPLARRREIVKALEACPVSRWVLVDDLFRYIVASNLDFDVTRDEWSLYVADANYGSLGYAASWSLVGGRYTLAVLFEYAGTLGLIDVAYLHPAGARNDYGDMWGADYIDFLSRYDGLVAFRLNPLGEYCLGRTPRYEPKHAPSTSQIRVLPTLDIAFMTLPVPPPDAAFVSLFAEQTSDAVWKLNRERILKSIHEGHPLSALRDFLASAQPESLPATVERFLSDIEERLGRVRDSGDARLIECQDHALAKLIAHDSRTRKLCMLTGDRHLTVRSADAAAFIRGLRQIGYVLSPGDSLQRSND